MAEVVNNIHIEENHDLDRIADLLENYTKETKRAYEKARKEQVSFVWVMFGVGAATTFINFYIVREFSIPTLNIWALMGWAFLNIMTFVFFFTFTNKKQKEIIAAKDNLQLSHNRLAEVIQFASQTLEHTKLTDIRNFEFKLLLKQAEDILQKTKHA